MEKTTWQYWLILGFGRFVQLFPYSWILRIGAVLGGAAYYFSGRHRERGVGHIQKALNYSEDQARDLIKEMYRNLGRSAFEVLYTPRLVRNPKEADQLIQLDFSPEFIAQLDQKKGGFLITAHYGNWEWLTLGAAMASDKMGTIVKYQPQPWVNAWLNGNRRSTGVEVFPRTPDGKEVLAGIRSLRKGGFLGLLCDQDGGNQGIIVPFFGRLSSSMAGPASLICRTGLPAFPSFIHRRPDGGHLLWVGKPLEPTQDINQMTAQIQEAIEAEIRKKPDEWLWLQRRWNTPVEQQEGGAAAE